jgi:CheY-like chemotaxis protein
MVNLTPISPFFQNKTKVVIKGIFPNIWGDTGKSSKDIGDFIFAITHIGETRAFFMYSILYVDDEEVLLGLNKIYLERTGEFSVDTAKSAQDGLRKIPEQQYDAIVSDYDMPHMDGIGFLKEVRSRFGNLPFLLFTGKGREEIVIQAVDNGVDYYIQKGHDMHGMIAELSHKIKRAVERRRISDDLERSRQQMNDIINFLPDATFGHGDADRDPEGGDNREGRL